MITDTGLKFAIFQPNSWRAEVWPFVFVVQLSEDDVYEASVKDMRSPLPAHIGLGSHYVERGDAEDACWRWLRKAGRK